MLTRRQCNGAAALLVVLGAALSLTSLPLWAAFAGLGCFAAAGVLLLVGRGRS
ncbi:MAG TPA: hypothetical protein VED40_06105 [Azospirillaceae bacterium]|nr:hypothetical protein [Azospirillaceae bacterium]